MFTFVIPYFLIIFRARSVDSLDHSSFCTSERPHQIAYGGFFRMSSSSIILHLIEKKKNGNVYNKQNRIKIENS